MGEPGLALAQVKELARKHFPSAEIIKSMDDGTFALITIHATGVDEYEVYTKAVTEWTEMKARGASVRSMLDDIQTDLKTPGMSRERHDNFQDSLDIVSKHVNDGVLTGVIPWITVPGINREIEDLRRRVSARLGMAAQDAATYDRAKKHASSDVQPLTADSWESLQRLVYGKA